MGLFNPGSGTATSPIAKAQRLDMLAGILGFFTVVAFIQAAYLEITGKPAVFEALVLLAFAVALGLTIRARRRLNV